MKQLIVSFMAWLFIVSGIMLQREEWVTAILFYLIGWLMFYAYTLYREDEKSAN